jgi:hypothetical protein
MRNVVAKMLLGLLVLNTGMVLAYTERVSTEKDKVLKTLVEIRDMVKQLKADQAKAPRYDAPCYGAPGTPVPPQPALDSAVIVREICCCLQELLGELQTSVVEGVATKIDNLATVVGTEADVMNCDDFIDLTCCDTINAKEQSVVAWLKLLYYTLNHGECIP